MKSFILEFMDFTSELESPGSFFLWSSFACIAGALRDNVWIRQGPRRTYPNIYVLLLADSAVARKSVPAGLIADLLQQIGATKVIRGRASIQAILQDLSTPLMHKKTGAQLMGGACLLCAEELASFIVQDPSAIPILTDIYDFRDEWVYNLKGSGKLIITGLCVSMLAASNEAHLREVYTNLAVYGGLMGRTFFIKPDEKRKGNSLFEDAATPLNGHYDTKDLTAMLKEITTLRGGFIVEKGSKIEYDKWYLDLHARYGERNDKSGVIARIHTGVLKIAMILAVGHNMELVIKQAHIEEAIAHCIKIIPNYEVFSMASGKASDSTIGAILFSELLIETNNNKMSRKLFIRNHWTEVDEEQFDMLAKKLETAGLIKSFFEDQDVQYSLTPLGREKLEARMKAKSESKGVGK